MRSKDGCDNMIGLIFGLLHRDSVGIPIAFMEALMFAVVLSIISEVTT